MYVFFTLFNSKLFFLWLDNIKRSVFKFTDCFFCLVELVVKALYCILHFIHCIFQHQNLFDSFYDFYLIVELLILFRLRAGVAGVVIVGQSKGLGVGHRETAVSFPYMARCCSILILKSRAQNQLGPLGAGLTSATTLVPGKRCSDRNSEQLHQLGSVLAKTVEGLSTKGCKCPQGETGWDFPLFFPPWSEMPLRVSVLAVSSSEIWDAVMQVQWLLYFLCDYTQFLSSAEFCLMVLCSTELSLRYFHQFVVVSLLALWEEMSIGTLCPPFCWCHPLYSFIYWERHVQNYN